MKSTNKIIRGMCRRINGFKDNQPRNNLVKDLLADSHNILMVEELIFSITEFQSCQADRNTYS
jgi:hypothetical protein